MRISAWSSDVSSSALFILEPADVAMLVADAVRLLPGERLRGIDLALRREPQHAAIVKDRRARGVGKLFPIWERFARHLRIKRVGAVTHADDAARPAR